MTSASSLLNVLTSLRRKCLTLLARPSSKRYREEFEQCEKPCFCDGKIRNSQTRGKPSMSPASGGDSISCPTSSRAANLLERCFWVQIESWQSGYMRCLLDFSLQNQTLTCWFSWEVSLYSSESRLDDKLLRTPPTPFSLFMEKTLSERKDQRMFNGKVETSKTLGTHQILLALVNRLSPVVSASLSSFRMLAPKILAASSPFLRWFSARRLRSSEGGEGNRWRKAFVSDLAVSGL